jgi:hypothetical protein
VIRKRKREYGGDTIVDATGIGDVVVSELEDIKAIGYVFTKRSKAELLTNLQSMFEMGMVGVPHLESGAGEESYWSLTDELRELNWESNSQADATMALALALWQSSLLSTKTIAPAFRVGEL